MTKFSDKNKWIVNSDWNKDQILNLFCDQFSFDRQITIKELVIEYRWNKEIKKIRNKIKIASKLYLF